MSATINLQGPSTDPGAPQITPNALDTAVNAALIANYDAAAAAIVNINTKSIEASGAVGDGVIDDQPKIQAWLNTLTSGAVVTMPPGNFYYIGGAPLVIPPHIKIISSYDSMDNPTTTGAALYGGGGFLINPALPYGIQMGAATALKGVKILRQGLIANPSPSQAQAAIAQWAAEATYAQTNAIQTTDTVIPLSSTTGISVGMYVSGPFGFGPVGVSPNTTVVSIVPNTSVTVSNPVSSLARPEV